jgi:hypothetical protein
VDRRRSEWRLLTGGGKEDGERDTQDFIDGIAFPYKGSRGADAARLPIHQGPGQR